MYDQVHVWKLLPKWPLSVDLSRSSLESIALHRVTNLSGNCHANPGSFLLIWRHMNRKESPGNATTAPITTMKVFFSPQPLMAQKLLARQIPTLSR